MRSAWGCLFVALLAGCNRDAAPPQPITPIKGDAKVEVVDPLKGAFDNKGGNVAQQPARQQEKPKSLVGNIRAKAIRTERQNELRQIAQIHGTLPSPPKTLDQFKNEFKVQAPVIHQAISEGYYTINLKARPLTSDIVAYETEGDTAGMHYYARANGTVDAMPGNELKAAVGQR